MSTTTKGCGFLNHAINALPFELHISGYQFCPGTHLKSDWLEAIEALIYWTRRIANTTNFIHGTKISRNTLIKHSPRRHGNVLLRQIRFSEKELLLLLFGQLWKPRWKSVWESKEEINEKANISGSETRRFLIYFTTAGSRRFAGWRRGRCCKSNKR